MTIALAQAAVTNHSSTGTSLTLTFATATTAGNCVIACISTHTGASTNPSVTGLTLGGSPGNFASLFQTGSTSASAAESITALWADPNCAGGQTSVVISFNSVSTPHYLASAYEFSGLASTTAALLDKSSAAALGSSGASWSSGTTATTSQASQLWFGIVTTDGTTITGPSSPWTNIAQVVEGSDEFMSGYQIRSATGAASYAGTFSGAGSYDALVVALNPAGTPPVTPKGPLLALGF